MGMFDFFVDSDGRELFAVGDPAGVKAEEIRHELERLGLPSDIRISVHGDCVKISGNVPDQASKEKIVLAIGNLRHVCRVDDQLHPTHCTSSDLGQSRRAGQPGLQSAQHIAVMQQRSKFHIVEDGETLAEIAAAYYDDEVHEAFLLEENRPMLTGADALFPGMVLRVPVLYQTETC